MAIGGEYGTNIELSGSKNLWPDIYASPMLSGICVSRPSVLRNNLDPPKYPCLISFSDDLAITINYRCMPR
jgi:hypothetical protein